MAERSFKAEVEDLRLGAGESFAGEGILALTKALLENGVGYVGGYQGAPISHLMDVLADAEDLLGELGVRFEANANEAAGGGGGGGPRGGGGGGGMGGAGGVPPRGGGGGSGGGGGG